MLYSLLNKHDILLSNSFNILSEQFSLLLEQLEIINQACLSSFTLLKILLYIFGFVSAFIGIIKIDGIL